MSAKVIVVAPDKFKGSLSAEQAALAIKQGIHAVEPDSEVICVPMADGGEGTVEAMVSALGGEIVTTQVHDPFMRSIESHYGVSSDGKTAYIEMATASGLLLLEPNEYDTAAATTYGTGELIADALKQGSETIYLGIGGSATTDAGIGMLSALGFRFFNSNNESIEPIGKNLADITSYSSSDRNARLDSAEIILLTDVSNPFYGENGAAHIFARQKGANQAQIEQLDRGLKNFATVVLEQSNLDINSIAGSGAGGGIAGGAVAGFGAAIRSGVEVVMELTGLRQAVTNAQIVVTGEGKLDIQTLSGKVVKGVFDLANEVGTPTAIFCGINELDETQLGDLNDAYIDAIVSHAENTDHAMSESFEILEEMANKMMRSDQGNV